MGECVVWGSFQGVPAEEVQATTTYWPMGLVCHHAGTVIAHQNWPATIPGYGCGLAALAGVVLPVLAVVHWQRVRSAAVSVR